MSGADEYRCVAFFGILGRDACFGGNLTITVGGNHTTIAEADFASR